jgi:hypothetical protein
MTRSGLVVPEVPIQRRRRGGPSDEVVAIRDVEVQGEQLLNRMFAR